MAFLDTRDERKSRNLLATWTDKQVVRDDEGEMKGIYLDVQLDQSHLTPMDVVGGKAQYNPHLAGAFDHRQDDGKLCSDRHLKYYSRYQFDQMMAVSEPIQVGDVHAIAFNANVFPSKNKQTGDTDFVVCCEKDINKAQTPEDIERIDAYNVANRFMTSRHELTAEVLDAQLDVSKMAFDHEYLWHRAVDYLDATREWPDNRTVYEKHDDEMSLRQRIYGRSGYDLAAEGEYMVRSVTVDAMGPYDLRKSYDDAVAAVDHMRGPGGSRFSLISSKLISNPDVLKQEQEKHDGVMYVDTKTGLIDIVRDFGNGADCRSVVLGDHGAVALGDAFTVDDPLPVRPHVVPVWYDTLDRQLEREAGKTVSNGYGSYKEMLDAWIDKDVGLGTEHGVELYEQTRKLLDDSRFKDNGERTLNPRAACTGIKPGKVSMSVPMIALWTDGNMTRDKATGEVNGVYLDVQIDQSDLTAGNIEDGSAFSSPSLSYAPNGRSGSPNQVWYSKQAFDAMLEAGSTADVGKVHGCSFIGNVRGFETKGKSVKSIVLTPKEIPEDASIYDRQDFEAYNQVNKLGPSPHEQFSSDDLKRQFDVTHQVRAKTKLTMDTALYREYKDIATSVQHAREARDLMFDGSYD